MLTLKLNPNNRGNATKVIYASTIDTFTLWPTRIAKAGTHEAGFLNFLGVDGVPSDFRNLKDVVIAFDGRKILVGYRLVTDSILDVWFVVESKEGDQSPGELGPSEKLETLSYNLTLTIVTDAGSYSQDLPEPIEVSVSAPTPIP